MIQIQLGHPKIINTEQIELKKVTDAFFKLFHTYEESCFLFWDGIPIRFRYKEDFYQSFNEILAMCWLLEREREGKTKAVLINQILTINLQLFWKNDKLTIIAEFEAHEELYLNYTKKLNKKSKTRISKQLFLYEWNTLLRQFLEVFKQGGVIIEEGPEKRKLELLELVENKIKRYGKLYVR